MTARKLFKELGYKRTENKNLNYIEYSKKEDGGTMCISFNTKSGTVYIRKYADDKTTRPQSLFPEELSATYMQFSEIMKDNLEKNTTKKDK